LNLTKQPIDKIIPLNVIYNLYKLIQFFDLICLINAIVLIVLFQNIMMEVNMASRLFNFKTCGTKMTKNAKACPIYGAKNKKPLFLRLWFIVLCIIFTIGAITACSGGTTTTTTAAGATTAPKATTAATTTATTTATTKATTTVAASKVTYEKFLSIKMGSALADVETLLGKGTEFTSSEIAGIKTIIYKWDGSMLSTLNVTIQNNVVSGKAQVGLKSGNENVNMEKYNQVKEGMTYEQVKAICGEGELSSQSKVVNIESLMYMWSNADLSSMSCTFSGSKMMMKVQMNLK
jgi:hypothetical protein